MRRASSRAPAKQRLSGGRPVLAVRVVPGVFATLPPPVPTAAVAPAVFRNLRRLTRILRVFLTEIAFPCQIERLAFRLCQRILGAIHAPADHHRAWTRSRDSPLGRGAVKKLKIGSFPQEACAGAPAPPAGTRAPRAFSAVDSEAASADARAATGCFNRGSEIAAGNSDSHFLVPFSSPCGQRRVPLALWRPSAVDILPAP